MKRTILLMITALMLSVGAQAQENKTTKKCGSCQVEKKDSCTNTKQCPYCKDLGREKKLAKIKGAARTLPLDSADVKKTRALKIRGRYVEASKEDKEKDRRAGTTITKKY